MLKMVDQEWSDFLVVFYHDPLRAQIIKNIYD